MLLVFTWSGSLNFPQLPVMEGFLGLPSINGSSVFKLK
jgi:hypothetical protein